MDVNSKELLTIKKLFDYPKQISESVYIYSQKYEMKHTSLLEMSVRYCCNFLKKDFFLTEEEIYTLESKTVTLLKDFEKSLIEEHETSDSRDFLWFLKNKLDTKRKSKMEQLAIIAILAVMITGLLLWLKSRRGTQDHQKDQEIPSHSGDKTPKEPVKTHYMLVLAIAIEGQQLIEKLKKNEYRVSSSDSADFLQHSLLIYYGSESDYHEHGISELFQDEHHLNFEYAKESVYDVFYVKFELKQPDDRFYVGGSTLLRRDAITELCENAVKVEVSGRYPKETYENKGFYNFIGTEA